MDLLGKIQRIVAAGDYRLGPHALRHGVEEGFRKRHIAEAVLCGRILELYSESERCLILGTFEVSSGRRENLHIIVDFSPVSEEIEWVDVVTAYIPRRPKWLDPRRRGKNQ